MPDPRGIGNQYYEIRERCVVIQIEVFSTSGCGECAKVRARLKAIAEAMGHDKITWHDINILDEMDYAVALGVMSVSAVAIDGRLAFSSLPSADTLRAELTKRLSA